MNLKQRVHHVFRRNTGLKTIGNNRLPIYRGLRGGLFTKNGTPVYNHGNGNYSTNKNFNKNSYARLLVPLGH